MTEHVTSIETAIAWASITEGMTEDQRDKLKSALVKAAEIAARETVRILNEQGK